MGIFYLPEDGVCGDFIPYYNQSRQCFELYYLHDYRDRETKGEGTPWRRLTTTDMVHFNDEGEMISRGTDTEQDLFCYTGCIVEHNGISHIYYTGHNYHLMEIGGKKEAVMHATSTDTVHWEKQLQDTFWAPDDATDIEMNDWRDPFVFYNEEEQKWWMLLCTRKLKGASRRRGATGLLVSDDLVNWRYTGSLWEPSYCWCPECPDIFRWGDYWYFIYSTFSETEGLRTYYRISDSPRGPWKNLGNNCFDGRAFYAGKTASDGENRYIFGWNPTRTGNTDSGVWQWGGHLIVHKLVQMPDGRLNVQMPEQLRACYPTEQLINWIPLTGQVKTSNDRMSLEQWSGFAAAMIEPVPGQCMLDLELKLAPGTDSAGIMVHSREQGTEGYYIRLEPGRGRFLFDREGRCVCEHTEIDRYLSIETGVWHHLTVILDDEVLLAYLDDAYALSARMCDIKGSELLAFVTDGAAEIRHCSLRPYQPELERGK